MLEVDIYQNQIDNNLTHKSNCNQSPEHQLPGTPQTPSPLSSCGRQNIIPSINVIKSSCSDLYTAEYEINDLKTPTRNTLTKGEVHDEIIQVSGTSVSIRGRYISLGEKNHGVTHPRPLYLYIQGKTEQSVYLAIEKINELIQETLDKSEIASNQEDRMTKFNNRPPPPMAPQQNANNQQKSTFAEKLMIGLEHAPPAFNLREQVIGAGGANLNYIRNETGAIATLRGRGSLFIDPALGTESPEPLHLYIEHYRYEGLQAAKQLAKNLIETLQQEVVHFQQLNQNTQNISFSNAGAIISQGQHVPQINVPPPMLAVPPPQIIQQNAIDSQNNQTTVMQPNFIQQNPPPTISGPPQTVQSSQQTVIHQQIIPQTVPIQLQQGNMVIQQQVQPPPTIGNVNIPPPGIPIPIKTGQIVQFQQPPPPPGASHLTQPPPNVQLQHPQTATATQIVLNPTQNYQYQYIQQPMQTGEAQMQPNQVTIQHIYQPQQQIQGIVQTATPQSQAQTMDQFQQIRSQQFQSTPSQQYITVQGSTAYMVPPPTIIHQQPASQPPQAQQVPTQMATSNQNIIIQPPPQLQQVQMQVQPSIAVQNLPPPPPVQQTNATQEQANQTNGTDENRGSPVKDEIKTSSDCEEISRKTPEEKSESDCQGNDGSGECNTQPPATTTAITLPPPPPPPSQPQSINIRPPPSQHLTSITLPATQVPPPIMAVPPPMTCVQHLVGNTLITTHPPAQTHTNQIYSQVPVSIHQIQPTGQQIHVSTPSGQHFVVNTTPQWQSGPPPTAQLTQQHQMQQISSSGTIQNVQITHQQIASSGADFRAIPPPGTTVAGHPPHQAGQQPSLMTLNPQVQVQFQPQMLQQFPPPHTIESAQIISGQVTQPPPQFNMVQSQPPNLHLPPGTYQQQNAIMTSFSQQLKQFTEQQPPRFGNKRKLEEEDGGPPNHQPRMGMGQREQQQNQSQNLMPSTSQSQQPPTSIQSSTSSNGPSMTNSVGGSANATANKGTDESNGPKIQIDRSSMQQQQHILHNQPPPPPPPQPSNSQFHHQDNRSLYKRDGNDSLMDNHPRPPFDGPPGGMLIGPPPHGPRGPRFHHGNGMMGPGPGFAIRPPLHMQDNGGGNFPMHRMNFGPPPPYRGDCPPNMGGGCYGPPPRFRGQW